MQSLQFFSKQARRCASAGLLAACLAATAAHAADDTLWAAASDASGKAYFAQHSLGDGAAAPGSANYFEAPNGAGAVPGDKFSSLAFRPDGTLWGAANDGGLAYFVQFDLTDGTRVAGTDRYFAAPTGGGGIAGDDLISMAFRPDGTLWGAANDDGLAYFAQFDLTDGTRVAGTDRYFGDAYSGGAVAGDKLVGLAFQPAALGAAVPEPASWALMIGGFGFAGATLRRRRRLTTVG